MRVWRIEHPHDGLGPYQADNETGRRPMSLRVLASHLNQSHDDPEHPTVSWQIEYYESCGFVSLTNAATWFDGWYRKLDAQGYVLVEYESDTVREIGSQCVFRKGAAQRIKEMSPLELDTVAQRR